MTAVGTTGRRLSPLILVAGLLLASFTALVSAGSAGAASCESRDAVGRVPFYSVEICITAPTAGSTLSGERSVSATVTVTAGGPGVQRVAFLLDGQPVLTDYAPPYTFTLPTQKFADGLKNLEAEATLRDGFKSSRASIPLQFNNGNASPPVNTNTFTPAAGTSPPAGQPFKVHAAGDGASGEPGAQAVTDVIADSNPNLFLYLGDVYEKGTSTEFHNWYGTPSTFFGRFRSITNPTVGNHEYENNQAPGYFDYWDNVPDYYGFSAGGWRFISLNSNIDVAPGSPQYLWLEQQLQTQSTTCTLAYMHHPVFSIGPQGDTTRLNAIWSLLASYGVDVVLTAHDHDYQRWVPLGGSGAPSTLGPTQFVVGTGGHGTQGFVRADSRIAASLSSDLGSLELRLGSAGATFAFLNRTGDALDSGSLQCSGSGSDTSPPSAPGNLTADSPGSRVDLSWLPSADNVGVTGYKVYRNGTLLADVGVQTTYVDGTVAPETTYTYEVRARDASGNLSAPSNSASVTIAPQTILFADGFESGGLSQWTQNNGLVVQQQQTFSGGFSARATSTGPAAWAYKTLPSVESNVYYRVRFKVVSLGSTANFMKFRTASGGSILGVYMSSSGRLSYRNDIAGVSTMSSTTVSQGVWHALQVHVLANGAASQTETWLNGVKIDALSKTENFGTAQVGRVQLGENSTDRTYDIALDGVTVGTTFVGDNTPPSNPVLTLSESSAYEHVSGNDVYYNPGSGAAGAFKVEASSTDGESTVTSVAFPTTFGGDSSLDTIEPFEKTYAFAAGATATGSRTVWATNGAGLSAGSAFGVIPDSSLPTGGSIQYLDGYVSTNAVLLALGDGTDTGSGVDENGESLERAEAPLVDGACGTFGGYVAITDVPAFDFVDLSVASARCYKYRLAVPDRVGNRSIFSTGSIVKVDADAPAVTLVNPGSTLTGVVGLTASATDAGGSGLQDVRFERSPAGANTWTTIGTSTATPYSASFDTTQVADGNYDLRAVARDHAGGSSVSAIAPVAVDNVSEPPVDTTPPTVALTAPAAGATVNGTIAISADASDNVAVTQVEFLVNGNVVGSDSSSPYSINWDSTTIANGSATINARASDGSNTSTTPDRTITVDNVVTPPGDTTPPTVTLNDPGTFLRGTKTLSATASDASGVTQVAFHYSPAGQNSWSPIATDTAAPYSANFVTTSVADGLYDLRAVATDPAGNPGTSVVASRMVDNTGATGSITAPATGAIVSGTAAVSATATDAGSGVSQITFERSPAGQNSWTAISVADTTVPYSVNWTTTSLTDGNYDLRGVILDDAGNQSTTPLVTVVVRNRHTFVPVADSYVNAERPSTNFGTATTIRVDASPEMRTYVKFNVDVSAPIVRATLRIFTASSSTTGYQVRGVALSNWGETTITFANAPAVSGTVTGSSGSFSSGVWTVIDVTPLATSPGLVTFGLTTPSSTSKSFSSREGLNPPQLIVETG